MFKTSKLLLLCLFQIDVDVLRLMDDKDLSTFIPSFGDRLALRHFLSKSQSQLNKSSSSDLTTRKNTVLERLQAKLAARSHVESSSSKVFDKTSSLSPSSLSRPMRKTKAIKRTTAVELRWLMVDDSGTKRKVKLENGGGVRKVDVLKTNNAKDLLNIATKLFFPDGNSKAGPIDHFHTSLLDYTQSQMDEGTTVEELSSCSGITCLRFYLATTAIVETDMNTNCNETQFDDNDSLADLDDIFGFSSANSNALVTLCMFVLYHVTYVHFINCYFV